MVITLTVVATTNEEAILGITILYLVRYTINNAVLNL
jgi:hypothetical protein